MLSMFVTNVISNGRIMHCCGTILVDGAPRLQSAHRERVWRFDDMDRGDHVPDVPSDLGVMMTNFMDSCDGTTREVHAKRRRPTSAGRGHHFAPTTVRN